MTLITLLIALTVERFLGSLQDYRRFDWLLAFARWVAAKAEKRAWLDGPLGVLLVLGPPAVVVGVLQALFAGSLVLSLLFALVVLIYCFGPRTFYDQAKSLVDALDRGDEEAARWYLEQLLDRRPAPDEPLPKAASEALFIALCDRLLAVVFWFAVLGPLGAFLWRASSELSKGCAAPEVGCGTPQGGLAAAWRWLYFVLGWVPARLTAWTFAALGSFMDARERCRRMQEDGEHHWTDPNEALLACAGCGALRLPESEETMEMRGGWAVCQSLELVRRSILAWLVVIAVLTLWGWAS